MVSFQDIIDIYLRRLQWKRYDTYTSRRRILLILIVVCFVVFYVIPLMFRSFWFSSPVFYDSNTECVEQYIRSHLKLEQSLDANIIKSYEQSSDSHLKHFVPYVANGKFAIGLNGDQSFYIMGKRALDVPIPYYPIVEVESFSSSSQYASIMRFTEGIVNKIICFDYINKIPSISYKIYAHRLISSLLMQEIKITNPSDVPLIVKLRRPGWTGKSDMKIQPMMIQHSDQTEYFVVVGQYEISKTKSIGLAIAFPHLSESIEVNSHSQKTIQIRTFINYTTAMSATSIAAKVPELKTSLREVIKKVIDISSASLERYHIDKWTNLWSSGFGLSYSKAPNALNGDVINATLYYLLSQRNAYSTDNDLMNLSEIGSVRSKSLLLEPDRCYAEHSTLQASTLWSNLDSLSDVNRICSLWLLTLEKQGCHNLINAGSEGVMQAMILSLGSLQFTNHHLEFNTNPNELHRNYYMRRVMFGNGTLINITVTLTDDNKAQIYVSLDKNEAQKDFYACDAGCLDSPVKLSNIPSSFPVKQTEPLTAILYITPDKQHIDELKHTIHVKEINEAPAHEHHTIVLHKYGHTLGGLPAMFWVSIVFLIVIFHLFLGKLIYNEYCGGTAVTNTSYDRHRQGRYAM